MQFASFSAWSTESLNAKVNAFLAQKAQIEVVDIKFTASFGTCYAAVLYR